MKNITVKELIKLLNEMNPDAVVCIGDSDLSYSTGYATIDDCQEVKNASYINDGGWKVVGDIVYFI